MKLRGSTLRPSCPRDQLLGPEETSPLPPRPPSGGHHGHPHGGHNSCPHKGPHGAHSLDPSWPPLCTSSAVASQAWSSSPSTAHGTLVKCPGTLTGPRGRESAGSSFCRVSLPHARARNGLCSGSNCAGFPSPPGILVSVGLAPLPPLTWTLHDKAEEMPHKRQ